MPDRRVGDVIFQVVLAVALTLAMIPIIQTFVTDAQAQVSAAQGAILGLITLVIIFGLIRFVATKMGASK
ncbi:MAG TPA: hypothetical protein VJ201_05665 [Candidatus Babeliales bacterium]|nr:hypothetical protein [Candidatus Babeliales bacterium]